MRNPNVRLLTLLRLTARLAVLVPFTALLYGPSPGVAATAPPLGGAEAFAVLGASTVTNTGPTVVTGDLGVSPGTSCTGFPAPCTGGPGTVIGTIHAADAVAAQAQTDATTASVALGAETCDTDLTGQDLGGMTLAPGVYCFDTSAQLTGVLTLTGGGPWIFQIGSTLTTASNSSVVNSGSGQDTDVFWAVGSSATLGTRTAFTGNILALASITLTTGASVSGRAIALTGAVTMDTNEVASTCSTGDCQHPLPVPPRVSQLLTDHLVCYQVRERSGRDDDDDDDENEDRDIEVSVQNQFGQQDLEVRKARLLCVPSLKTLQGDQQDRD